MKGNRTVSTGLGDAIDGALALQLDFGESPATGARRVQAPRLRLASGRQATSGPAKYRALELRRRRAQIEARRLLDALDTHGAGEGGR